MCYLWDPGLLWLHVGSDVLITSAYFTIPLVLVSLVVRARRDIKQDGLPGLKGLPYDWMFIAFGLFIVACGATHLFSVITVWKPVYWASGAAKAVTAVASVATAVALPPLVPRALSLVREARAGRRHLLDLERANGELRELYGKLRDLDRLKSEFFMNVSYELRTPLTLILGPSEKMLESGTLLPVHRRQAEAVYRNALHLLAHVDDLLEAGNLQFGAAVSHPTEVDFAHLVRQVAEHFQFAAAHRDMRMEVDTPASMVTHLDRSKTERIVLNLLSNAFKFTGRESHVRMHLEREEAEVGGTWAVLRIEDDGPGVPRELWEVVFEHFRQADGSMSRPAGGAGLGLSIARDFAAMQGGTITLGSSPLGGAALEVRLPVVSEPDGGAEAPDDRPLFVPPHIESTFSTEGAGSSEDVARRGWPSPCARRRAPRWHARLSC
jgi:signal transduction histidine kinase